MKKIIFALVIIIPTFFSNANNFKLIDTITPIPKKSNKTGKFELNKFTYSNPYKVTSFCKLIQVGNINAVKHCINNGANINKKSLNLTPLMYAARHNRTAILKMLIAEGANLKAKSCNGLTALDWAKNCNAIEAYNLLLKARKS